MVANTLNGTATAAAIKASLRARVTTLAERDIVPGLATVLVGDHPGSRWYVAGKHRDCAEIGVASIRRDLPATATQHELEAVIDELGADPTCTGMIVQLPLPEHLDTDRLLERINPAKDADGLHPTNLGRLMLNVNRHVHSPLPCTPLGIIELVSRHGISWSGKRVTVVGRGITVGRPLAALLTRSDINATVTLTHTGTIDLGAELSRAEVIVAAAGVPGVIQAEHVRPGAIVLDVGVSRRADTPGGTGRIVGDVDPAVAAVAAWLSPNPGGVGPMTRAMLLSNVVQIAERALVDAPPSASAIH